MIEQLVRLIKVERVDDIPLLLAQLQQMKVAALLNKHFPVGPHWVGELTFGEVVVVWLAFIVCEGDHRLNHLQSWAATHLHTLDTCLQKPVRDLDFSDDRLADILDALSDPKAWCDFECDLNQTTIRVYDLKADTLRIDSTTAKTYAEVDEQGLFRFGHSKDHRPDLAQVKINLSTLDPLGLPVTTTVVSGNCALDPLYLPEIKRVQVSIGAAGKTYIGDSKMAAVETRAYLASSGDYYLCPLAGKHMPCESLASLVRRATEGKPQLTSIKSESKSVGKEGEKIAEGYEMEVELESVVEGKLVKWVEPRLVVRSLAQARKQRQSLEERIKKAQAEIARLNERKQGKKQLSESELEAKAEQIVARHKVDRLIKITLSTLTTETPVRAYGEREARLKQQSQSSVTAEVDEEAMEEVGQGFGWKVYATNQSRAVWTIALVVLAYRGQYLIEHGFGRLKGKALSLDPLYLRTDNRIIGLIRLLMIALRLITLIEFVVRRELKEEGAELKGLHNGQATRATARPTTELLLEAFRGVSLTVIEVAGKAMALLEPLSRLQERILQLLGLSSEIYLRLVDQFSNLQFLKPAPV